MTRTGPLGPRSEGGRSKKVSDLFDVLVGLVRLPLFLMKAEELHRLGWVQFGAVTTVVISVFVGISASSPQSETLALLAGTVLVQLAAILLAYKEGRASNLPEPDLALWMTVGSVANLAALLASEFGRLGVSWGILYAIALMERARYQLIGPFRWSTFLAGGVASVLQNSTAMSGYLPSAAAGCILVYLCLRVAEDLRRRKSG